MSKAQRGLGRGLDALFKHTIEPLQQAEITKLPIRLLIPNPAQPRTVFTESALQELASSIKIHGILQPLLVRPLKQEQDTQYEIIAGERRWRASQLAGLREVPVVVREIEDNDVLALALIENLQREDLNPVEEALALQTLRTQYGLSQDELAKQLGKSRPAIANMLRLLQLSESILHQLREGHITAGHARALLSITEPAQQEQLCSCIIEHNLSVRETEEQAHHWKTHGCFPTTNQLTAEAHPQQQQTRRAKAPELKQWQKRLSESLSVKTRLTGSPSKGKITLSYENPEELTRLLQQLGIQDNAR